MCMGSGSVNGAYTQIICAIKELMSNHIINESLSRMILICQQKILNKPKMNVKL